MEDSTFVGRLAGALTKANLPQTGTPKLTSESKLQHDCACGILSNVMLNDVLGESCPDLVRMLCWYSTQLTLAGLIETLKPRDHFAGLILSPAGRKSVSPADRVSSVCIWYRLSV